MNPYEAVDIDSFAITPAGERNGLQIMRVHLAERKGFDSVVFRNSLTEFLFSFADHDWHLGNDNRYTDFPKDDLELVLHPEDLRTMRDYGWL